MANEPDFSNAFGGAAQGLEAPPTHFAVVPPPQVSGLGLPQTITTPEHLDWHMIQDHELTQLSSLQSGIIASLGFTGLGAAIGLAGPFMTALGKLEAKPPQSVAGAEVYYLVGFSGTVMLALVCLVIALLDALGKRGLAATIRGRPKLGMARTS